MKAICTDMAAHLLYLLSSCISSGGDAIHLPVISKCTSMIMMHDHDAASALRDNEMRPPSSTALASPRMRTNFLTVLSGNLGHYFF